MEQALKTTCRLIQDYMNLDNNHIYLYNNKWVIPKDGKLCVVVGTSQETPFFTSTTVQGTTEENTTLSSCNLNINVFSRNREALYRKNEILMALNTSKAINSYVALGFYIPRLPTTFTQIDEVDGTGILTRYEISFNMYYKTNKFYVSNYIETIDFDLITNK